MGLLLSPRNNNTHEKQDHSMALRQINACLGLYEIQAKKKKKNSLVTRSFGIRIHGKEAWCWRRRGHITPLLSQTFGAPPGCLHCCGSQVSHCRLVGHGRCLLRGHTQRDAVVDPDHLRKNPHCVSRLPLKMKKMVKRHSNNDQWPHSWFCTF